MTLRRRARWPGVTALVLLLVFVGPRIILELPADNGVRMRIIHWLEEKGCEEVDRDTSGRARKGVVCGDPQGVQLRL